MGGIDVSTVKPVDCGLQFPSRWLRDFFTCSGPLCLFSTYLSLVIRVYYYCKALRHCSGLRNCTIALDCVFFSRRHAGTSSLIVNAATAWLSGPESPDITSRLLR